MRNSLFSALCACLAIATPGLGCGKNDDQITTVRPIETPAAPAAQASGASSAERFGMRSGMPGAMAAGPVATFDFETPEGWQPLPPSSMRLVNFQVGRDPNAEAYFTTMGGGGGLAANVNRWRKQMGLPEISDAEIAQLPKKELLGHEAVYLSVDGAFAGMGSEPKENYRMLGLIALDGDKAYFAKMTGPIPVLEGQEENFLAFTASLNEGAAADPHAGMAADPHTGVPGMDAGAPAVTAWRWQAPEVWTKAADRPMRLVTYNSGPDNQNEVYIAELGGPAGGVEMNVNRWRQQMGQEPLSADDIAALPKVPVMGHEAPVVEIDGTFTDTMRGGTFPDYVMYGTIIPAGERTLFIKMVGPKDAMSGEKENFKAFTQSIAQAE